MKATFKSSLLLLIASAAIVSSCTKSNEVKAYLTPGTAPMFNTTITTLVLTQANAGNNAGSFSWSAADFGYKASINYTLQFSKGGTNFANPATTTELVVGTALSKTIKVSELNAKMQEIITDGVATPIDVRVKADVGSGVAPIYSNVARITLTSYLDIVSYGFPDAMNVAGNYQGWDPGSAPQIARVRNGNYAAGYEGYIVFNDPSPQFKIVKGNNWGAGDYGLGGGAGTIASPSGTNITLPSGGAGVAGLYRVRANTTNNTWSFYKVNTFGIIGDATPGGWGASTPMTFSNGSWSITANLTAGEIKFRANDDWAVNFGDNDPADNKPEYDGANIKVTVAGNYTISLNIGIAGNYSYKLKKN